MSVRITINDDGPFGNAIRKRCGQLGISQPHYLLRIVSPDLILNVEDPELERFCREELGVMDRKAAKRKERAR